MTYNILTDEIQDQLAAEADAEYEYEQWAREQCRED